MRLRIEFTDTRSKNFQRVLQLCRKLPTFKTVSDGGLTLYSVEFESYEFASAYAIIEFVRGWQSTAYYVDDILVSRNQACRAVFGAMWAESKDNGGGFALRRHIRAAATPNDLIRRQKPSTDI